MAGGGGAGRQWRRWSGELRRGGAATWGEERRGEVLILCARGGVLGYLYWGREGFAWGRGQEID